LEVFKLCLAALSTFLTSSIALVLGAMSLASFGFSIFAAGYLSGKSLRGEIIDAALIGDCLSDIKGYLLLLLRTAGFGG
jgi:hypothetical protein